MRGSRRESGRRKEREPLLDSEWGDVPCLLDPQPLCTFCKKTLRGKAILLS